MITAESVKAKLQGLIATANAATGNADADLTAAVNALVAGFGQGGEEVFQTKGGILYKKDMVCPEDAQLLTLQSAFGGAEHMETFSALEWGGTVNQGWYGYYTFENCTNLKKVYMPKITGCRSYMPFRSVTSVEEMQLGSIGHPVESILYGFSGNCAATVTIYVADDATVPFGNAPFDWPNATIIYRSAITGEVRTV